jgi:imidazolonepropionase-like amidohydrolase
VLRGGDYLDARAGTLRPNGAIVVRDGKIEALHPPGSAAHRPVYAHAIGRAGALLAAGHGVRALAHAPVVDSAAAAALERTGIAVITTLATLSAGRGGAEVRRAVRLLHGAGVPLVLGTDAGVLPHGRNAWELAALVEAGLTPLETLRAATVDAAALLGLDEVGEIAAGKAGDFPVVEGNPLENIRALERPVLVVKGGKIPRGVVKSPGRT